MNKSSSKAETAPQVPAAGNMSLRLGVPAVTCFIVSFACFLCSGIAVRLLGALFMAATFAMMDWEVYKAQAIKTKVRDDRGMILRREQPLRFACLVLLLLLFELSMVVGLAVRAMQSPG